MNLKEEDKFLYYMLRILTVGLTIYIWSSSAYYVQYLYSEYGLLSIVYGGLGMFSLLVFIEMMEVMVKLKNWIKIKYKKENKNV